MNTQVRWLNGRASDYESGGSRFDPWVDRHGGTYYLAALSDFDELFFAIWDDDSYEKDWIGDGKGLPWVYPP